MALKFTTSYIEDSLSLFRHYKKAAEGAMAQVTDAQLVAALDAEMNSIAVIVKHMAGNMPGQNQPAVKIAGTFGKVPRLPKTADVGHGRLTFIFKL
jgi:hypothetical protein